MLQLKKLDTWQKRCYEIIDSDYGYSNGFIYEPAKISFTAFKFIIKRFNGYYNEHWGTFVFDNREDAQEALDYFESVITMEKLRQ